MNILDIEIPSSVMPELAILFEMPPELMAEIVYNTETVEERNITIFSHCLMFYITKKYKLKSFDEFVDQMQENTDKNLTDFFAESTKRMEKKYGKIT
jgi:hypothetical protein